MSSSRKRRGITLIELLWLMVFLAVAFFILSRPSYRAVEMIRAVTSQTQYDAPVAIAAFFLTLFSWLCMAVGVYALRIRYGDLLYFPLFAGIPLGFAVVPFRPFSLPLYGLLVATSMIAIPVVCFFLQSAVVLFYRATTKRRRSPLPETLPPFSPGYTPYRAKPVKDIKDLPPHPNVTQAWADFHNSIGIHYNFAIETWIYDIDVDEFRAQLSLYCRKLLSHYKQPTGYLRYWDRETQYLEMIIKPCAALDFQGAQDWAEYVRATLPVNAHFLSKRDEQLIRAMCAVVENDDVELERLNRELAKPLGWLNKMTTRSPEFWDILIAGLAERHVERCREAIRIQAEEWYIPVLADHYRLNVNGVAMTNLCRWRGLGVPALEPVIPEALLLSENSP